jgi:chemotaxis-related protein WspB
MVFLVFQLDNGRYALDAGQVVEVLPYVEIRQVPQAPPGVAGIFDFRGTPVPVIDLSLVALGRPARRQLSTRLIVVRSVDFSGNTRLLALVAEKATDIMRREPADFVDSGVSNNRASYLGPVATDDRGLVQWIDATMLLPPPVREVLSMPSAEVK